MLRRSLGVGISGRDAFVMAMEGAGCISARSVQESKKVRSEDVRDIASGWEEIGRKVFFSGLLIRHLSMVLGAGIESSESVWDLLKASWS